MAARSREMPSLFFFFVFFIGSTFTSEVACQAQSNHGDKQILLRIKKEWGGEPVLDSWTDSAAASHCSWAGVGCAADGSVVNLTLSGISGEAKISRPLPASLCDLKNLSSLNLGFNNIPGGFPTSLYSCSALRRLDLSQNLFVGEIPADVGSRLSPLLTHLDLSSNNFSGDVPPSIGRLRSLQELLLNSNLFNGSFPAEIGELSQLQVLTLAYNPFTPTRIPPEFGNLTSLQLLFMRDANLQGEIPASFSKLVELVRLDLSYNSLSGAIPAGIWGLPRLRFLILYKNNLTGSIVINGTIEALDLEQLDLSINQLNGSIPEDFGKLQYLTVLHMFFNNFSGEIPASIGRLPWLYDLKLFSNSLTGVLPPELGKNSPLSELEVDDNMLTGELPGGLCDGGFFTSIVVFNNKLTGNLSALGKCPLLDNLQVFHNQFSGEVPEGIWLAENMTTVMMSDNALSGELPDKLPLNLTRLEIANNRFAGKVPSSAPNLAVFLASNNMFSELPQSLSGLSNLQTFDLGGNLIAGTIPEDVSSLAELNGLNLSHNQFDGSIPAAIGSLQVLTSLDLSKNKLSGAIPPQVGNLKLNFLNLSSNQLTGEIPAALQTLAYEESFLSNPGLCASSNSANLKVAACRARSGSGSKGISGGLRIFLILLALLVFMTAAAFSAFLYTAYLRRRDGGELDPWKLTSFQSLDFTESNILRGISDENIIGSGGAGKVYKVSVGDRNGEVVAVKKIWSSRKLNMRLEKQFLAEVEILGSIRHKNIVKLLCCVSSSNSKLLVYEYMKNGSLDSWLHPLPTAAGAQPRLSWPTRLEIATGAARGLCYMHHDCSPPIIHRDVKSSNILLDSDFNARIADFGLARMLSKSGEPGSVSIIAGSFGYLAPECGYSSRLNEKVDVYSFGVVLLELTTGRKANYDGDGDGDQQCNLAEWVRSRLQEGSELSDAVDPSMRGSPWIEDIAMVLKLGIICTESSPARRPSMKEVLHILSLCSRPIDVVACNARAEDDGLPLLPTTENP